MKLMFYDVWFLFQCIDRMEKDIEGYKAEVKKKDSAIKGLQEILKKEQQSRQEKLALQEDHFAQ